MVNKLYVMWWLDGLKHLELETLTDLLKELLHIDSVSGAGLHENSCDGLSKVLSFFHRNFPVKRDTTISTGFDSSTGL